jgi:hypothetical protein
MPLTLPSALLAGASTDAILQAKLAQVVMDTRQQQAKSLEQVVWGGARYTVEPEKLRVKFIEIKELVTTPLITFFLFIAAHFV